MGRGPSRKAWAPPPLCCGGEAKQHESSVVRAPMPLIAAIYSPATDRTVPSAHAGTGFNLIRCNTSSVTSLRAGCLADTAHAGIQQAKSTQRCTRSVAIHPLRRDAPDQKGCNAYGSGAPPPITSTNAGICSPFAHSTSVSRRPCERRCTI